MPGLLAIVLLVILMPRIAAAQASGADPPAPPAPSSATLPPPPPPSAAAYPHLDPWQDTRFATISAGLGVAVRAPTTSGAGGSGTGFYAGAEYGAEPTRWLSPRLYGGLMLIGSRGGSCGGQPCDVSAQVGFIGGKGRLTVPIPYVAPFFALGLGVAVGNMNTITPSIHAPASGAFLQVPIEFGVSLGKSRSVEMAFEAFVYPTADQLQVALGVTLKLPIGQP